MQAPKPSAASAHARALLAAGQLTEGEAAYRRLLLAEPAHGEALRALAAIAAQRRDWNGVRQFAVRALEAEPDDLKLRLALARAHRELGDGPAALDAYGEVLRRDPSAESAWVGMGILHREAGRDDDALACYRQALALDERNAVVWINVANVLLPRGRIPEAESAYRAAIRCQPELGEPYVRLGTLLSARGEFAEAEQVLQRALERMPLHAGAHAALAAVLTASGAFEPAVLHLRAAGELAPSDLEIHMQLAECLRRLECYDEAIPVYRRCLVLEPAARVALVNLGGILRLRGEVEEAASLARRAIEVDPGYAMGYAALAETCLSAGDAPAAAALLEEGLSRDPAARVPASNYLLLSNYLETVDPAELLRRHRDLGRRFAPADPGPWIPRGAASREAGAPLRVGLVSADLRDHSVAHFLEPWLLAHDPAEVIISCYSNNFTGDAVTERIRARVAKFVPCADLDDAALADQITRAGIEVLIDLSGHTAGNRLTLFGRRAAPVQATWLGYPTTTGVPGMDFRLTDAVIDPPTSPTSCTERLLRLPHSMFCYRPPDHAPAPTDPPVLQNGTITFGSFNNLAKVGEATLRTWASVLAAMPQSRLLLKARGLLDAGARRRFAERLAGVGVDPARVDLVGWSAGGREHLSAYGRVDIALDTTPYNGATTTCEALWMGVPVVTRAGSTHASRMGASILGAAGFAEWVCGSDPDFVACACHLAADPAALRALRHGMRERLAASALLDGRGFAVAMREALSRMVAMPGDPGQSP